MIEYATNWRAASACLNADPDIFFPVAVGTAAGTQVSRALRICQDCTVRQHCLDFAMQSGEKEGIWGGTTPEERVRARRARNRRAARSWREAPQSRAS
ncbi:MAG: WhiB family transcriptional regulator [Trebonia sp.]